MTRPKHLARHPIHITLRAVAGVRGLRRDDVLRALHACIASATRRGRRIAEFSLQENHLHLIVEASGELEVTRTVRGLASITARRFNRCLGRRGMFWEDRYHRHDLRTPTEVRNALAYVLMNDRKHGVSSGEGELDAYSSAAWFDGWDERSAKAARLLGDSMRAHGVTRCTAAPRTFLLAHAWRRLGPLKR